MKQIFIILAVAVALSTQKSTTPKYFWYPQEDGKPVLAFTEGSPPDANSILNDITEVKFFHYSQRNPNAATELVPFDDASFDRSNWVQGAPLKIISHGFSSNGQSGFPIELKNSYIASGRDVNIISIDWGKFAAAPWYNVAAENTRPVGVWTAFLLEYLVGRGAVSLANIHFTGHSLGAHVAGFCGAEMAGRIGKMGRISGLDVALPLFGEKGDDARLDPSDANFVDVIHTAGGTLLDGGLAFTDPVGHIDFYPNSGLPPQPGCAPDLVGSCSHSRVHHLFRESISSPTGFKSCKCNDWNHFLGSCNCNEVEYMGEYTDTSSRGLYYLRTNNRSPFSQF